MLEEEAVRRGGVPPVNRPRRERSIPAGQGVIRPMGYHWYLPCKAVVDRTLALALLVLAAPLVALAALLVKLTSRGPAFYTQTRLGLNGRPFTIYKLRTMIHECESLTGPRWAIRDDPRVTPVGHLLRKSHLDELPQLFNILRGDMTFVGPRPERPHFVAQFRADLPHYQHRHRVPVGLTGLAQVSGLRGDTSIDDRARFDNFYIENWSLWLDVKVILRTVRQLKKQSEQASEEAKS